MVFLVYLVTSAFDSFLVCANAKRQTSVAGVSCVARPRLRSESDETLFFTKADKVCDGLRPESSSECVSSAVWP